MTIEQNTLIIILTILVVGLGLGLLFLALRKKPGSGDELGALIKEFDSKTRELSGRLAQLSDDSRKAQSELSKVVADRLDKVSQRMGQSLEDSATKTAKSMGEIKTRLLVIDDAQKNILELSGEIVGLQNILSNKQARGAFGEVQLKDLVSGILPPQAYKFQATLSNNRVADCLINLPNPPGPIVVDAKFPLESFHLLRKAEDPKDKERAGKVFAADILRHVEDISGRYIIPHETADSALMFLPSEAVYAELYANFPAVVEKSYKKKVWIVSPTTLMATLNTVRAILMDVKMREQAGLIQKEVGILLEDVGRLGERVSNLGRHFNQAESDLREITTSTGKITKRGKRIKDVKLEDDEEVKESLTPNPDRPRIVKS
ncbi:MAG: DNA recombination protein RmuC [Alphaproteobacteria bacterium]